MEKFKNIETYIEEYGEKLIDFLPSLVGAILMLIVGLWIIRFINRVIAKFFQKKDYDVTLEKFSASLINWGLKILLFVLVINQLGVESASLVAVIGAAGLAVGFALQHKAVSTLPQPTGPYSAHCTSLGKFLKKLE